VPAIPAANTGGTNPLVVGSMKTVMHFRRPEMDTIISLMGLAVMAFACVNFAS
jgi:hypothetical protein